MQGGAWREAEEWKGGGKGSWDGARESHQPPGGVRAETEGCERVREMRRMMVRAVERGGGAGWW